MSRNESSDAGVEYHSLHSDPSDFAMGASSIDTDPEKPAADNKSVAESKSLEGSSRSPKQVRRKSLDLSYLAQLSPSSKGSFLLRDPSKTSQRSRSLWAVKDEKSKSQNNLIETADLQNTAISPSIPPESSERQRYLNVKRSRKLMQVCVSEISWLPSKLINRSSSVLSLQQP
jgi:hypothetical protein